ncbi:MAG: flavin reductase family protein [Xanthobacteraceae bacterium]|nr:flavin reductase family protein [Xanthobacteraceae bacterium]
MINVTDQHEPIDPRDLRNALGRYPTGVAVITTRAPNGKFEGLTANSLAAVSLAPPLILWSLRREAPSIKSFLAAGTFVVNVLSEEQSHLSDHFAKPSDNKFDRVTFSTGWAGCPVLHESLAVFECDTESTTDGGDHVIFLGRIRRIHHREGSPLIFSGGKYHSDAPLVAKP